MSLTIYVRESAFRFETNQLVVKQRTTKRDKVEKPVLKQCAEFPAERTNKS
jgi:hypothetical protein